MAKVFDSRHWTGRNFYDCERFYNSWIGFSFGYNCNWMARTLFIGFWPRKDKKSGQIRYRYFKEFIFQTDESYVIDCWKRHTDSFYKQSIEKTKAHA